MKKESFDRWIVFLFTICIIIFLSFMWSRNIEIEKADKEIISNVSLWCNSHGYTNYQAEKYMNGWLGGYVGCFKINSDGILEKRRICFANEMMGWCD